MESTIKNKIQLDLLQKAMNIYFRYGIKSITMDDLARHLGKSKKTIYKYVSDKNDLVRKVMMLQLRQEEHRFYEIREKNLDAVEELFEINKYVSDILKKLNPSIQYDLNKYHKEAFNDVCHHREEMMFNCVLSNLKKGMDQGYYRPDLNAEIITKLHIGKMNLLFDGEFFPPDKYTFYQVHQEYFYYHMRGILSEKGTTHLNEILNNQAK